MIIVSYFISKKPSQQKFQVLQEKQNCLLVSKQEKGFVYLQGYKESSINESIKKSYVGFWRIKLKSYGSN